MNLKCPHCSNDDKRLMEIIPIVRANVKWIMLTCVVCCKEWTIRNDEKDN